MKALSRFGLHPSGPLGRSDLMQDEGEREDLVAELKKKPLDDSWLR